MWESVLLGPRPPLFGFCLCHWPLMPSVLVPVQPMTRIANVTVQVICLLAHSLPLLCWLLPNGHWHVVLNLPLHAFSHVSTCMPTPHLLALSSSPSPSRPLSKWPGHWLLPKSVYIFSAPWATFLVHKVHNQVPCSQLYPVGICSLPYTSVMPPLSILSLYTCAMSTTHKPSSRFFLFFQLVVQDPPCGQRYRPGDRF